MRVTSAQGCSKIFTCMLWRRAWNPASYKPAAAACRSSTRMLATTAKLAALGCLVHTAAAVPREDSSSPKLYVCQGGQCVLNVAGLPLSECEAACIPRPSANYTCQGGQCVINSRGLPKAECDLVCGGPGPAPPPAPPAKPNIVQLADSVPDLSTLVEALKAANLTGALSGPGPFTVFAPNNKAFGALAPTVLKSLLDPANRLQLQAVLEYHAAENAVYSKELTNHERIPTLQGQSVEITLLNGDVFVDRSRVVKADNGASNGYVRSLLLRCVPVAEPLTDVRCVMSVWYTSLTRSYSPWILCHHRPPRLHRVHRHRRRPLDCKTSSSSPSRLPISLFSPRC